MLFAIGILLVSAIAAIILIGEDKKGIAGGIFGLGFVISLFLFLSSFIGFVPTGYRGVVLQFGAANGELKGEGIYFVTPFVQGVDLVSMQTQVYVTPKTLEASSFNLQTVHTDVAINYRLDPNHVVDVYRNVQKDWVARVIEPTLPDRVKAHTAEFSATDLIQRRTALKDNIERDLKERYGAYGLLVDSVSLNNFGFSKEFSDQVELVVVAQQRVEQSKQDLLRVDQEKQAAIARAEGEAEAIRIRGNALQNNPSLVNLELAQRWDGHLPQTALGDSIPLFQINK